VERCGGSHHRSWKRKTKHKQDCCADDPFHESSPSVFGLHSLQSHFAGKPLIQLSMDIRIG
jgi:hypothetical protein